MKQYTWIFLLALVTLSSCEVIGGIFKAGVWTGLILVALVLALIIFLISRTGKRN
ncbi:phosphatidate cytidylyltransferase [Chitinophaga lutea]